jgi:hypothetical protein
VRIGRKAVNESGAQHVEQGMSRFPLLHPVICLAALYWSGVWLLVLSGALIWDANFAESGGGNHWWLFGTWIDRLVVRYPEELAFAAAIPLVLPLLVRRSLVGLSLVALGAVDCWLMFGLLKVAGD